MLVEDLGPRTLGEWGRGRPWSELAGYFEHALEISRAHLAPARGRPRGAQSACSAGSCCASELAQTWDLFLEPQGLVSDPALAAELRAALDTLCATLGDEPPVPCHRDFMVRNLMPLPDGAASAGARPPGPAPGAAALRPGLAAQRHALPAAEAEEALLAAAALPAGRPRSGYHRAAAQRTPEGGGDLRQVRPPGGGPAPAADRADPGPFREAFFPGSRKARPWRRGSGRPGARPGGSRASWICYTGFAIEAALEGRRSNAPGERYAFPRCS